VAVAHLPHELLFAAIAFVGVALAIVDPLLVAMLAVPGVLFVERVGGASLNISVCDVLTVAGTIVAVPMLRADMRVTRRLLWVAVLFQAVLLLVVVAHPNEKSVFEWFHRFFLVGGSIAIGAALGRARRASAAVVAFLVLASGLSIAAIVTTAAHGFASGHTLGLQKNFVGAMCGSAVLIAFLRPAWVRLSHAQALTIAVLCSIGLFASQSRGAIAALAAALFIGAVRQGRVSRREVIAVIVVTPLVLFAVSSVRHQSHQHEITSLTYRADYSALAYREWHLSPVFGQGLRFFKQPGALTQVDTPSVIASTLAEGGVVGVLALGLLVGSALLVLWRLPRDAAALAVAFVVGRFAHGLFDIYWVAGTTTLPWLIVGIVCGNVDADVADGELPELANRPEIAPSSRL
jgi:polysaccharide biosynthesis protein PslJ